MMAIDDLLDRGRDAKRRREESSTELAAVIKALEGLDDVGILDAPQKRELGRLKAKPRAAKRTRRRRPAQART